MSFIARYVYTYEEFVLVTEAPQCNRMIATRQDTDNKKNNIQIYCYVPVSSLGEGRSRNRIKMVMCVCVSSEAQ